MSGRETQEESEPSSIAGTVLHLSEVQLLELEGKHKQCGQRH